MKFKKQAAVKLGLVVGGNLIWAMALRSAVKTVGFVLKEYSRLYEFETLLARKIYEQCPEIWDDEEVVAYLIDYQFYRLTENYEGKLKY